MFDNLLWALALLTVLGCGLTAGILFIFSNTVMRSLSQLDQSQGISTMQYINADIQNPLFFLVFVGPAVSSVVLAASSLRNWQANSAYLLAGSLLYLVGVFLVTVVVNVPMNNALAEAKPASEEAANLWGNYLTQWTTWNHVRTVAALLAMCTFVLALW